MTECNVKGVTCSAKVLLDPVVSLSFDFKACKLSHHFNDREAPAQNQMADRQSLQLAGEESGTLND